MPNRNEHLKEHFMHIEHRKAKRESIRKGEINIVDQAQRRPMLSRFGG